MFVMLLYAVLSHKLIAQSARINEVGYWQVVDLQVSPIVLFRITQTTCTIIFKIWCCSPVSTRVHDVNNHLIPYYTSTKRNTAFNGE